MYCSCIEPCKITILCPNVQAKAKIAIIKNFHIFLKIYCHLSSSSSWITFMQLKEAGQIHKLTMKFIFYVSLLFLIAHSAHCVRVTLKDGAVSDYNLEVVLDDPVSMPCSFSPDVSGGGGQSNVEWLYATVKDSDTQNNIVYQGTVGEKYMPQFSLVPPSSLQIQSVKKENKGFYTCSITLPNDSPSKGQGTYNLTVLVAPSEPVCQFTSDFALTLGFSAEFRCNSVEGIPRPTYTWYKDGNLLPENSQTNNAYKNTSYTYSPATGTITFSKVTSGDAGIYYCQAENKQGTAACKATRITTKDQDVGLIVGIVFACIFGVLLIGVLVWWTWRRGYCDGFKGRDDDDDVDGEDANDIMLDGNGPMVNKPPSEFNGSTGKQEASMMI